MQPRTNLSIIAALANNRVIGRANRLPWHLPADLAHFKRLTMGKPILMGRKTWDSLPGLLPHRTHIVVTRNPAFAADGALVAPSLDEALQFAGDVDEIMIIGGADLYEQTLPIANRLYLTLVDTEIDGDAFFPSLDDTAWREVAREHHDADQRHAFAFAFVTLERQKP
jgi:dihydrofolate reductase